MKVHTRSGIRPVTPADPAYPLLKTGTLSSRLPPPSSSDTPESRSVEVLRRKTHPVLLERLRPRTGVSYPYVCPLSLPSFRKGGPAFRVHRPSFRSGLEGFGVVQ